MADIATFDIEAFIRSLPWHGGDWGEITPDDVKTAVAGNLRNLFAVLKAEASAPPPSASPLIELAGHQYLKNASGALVPTATIRAQDRLRDEMVRKIIGFARALSAQIARFKGHTFSDVNGYQSLLEQEYGAKEGGKKGNVSFISFDGLLKVKVQIADRIDFGPELQIAKKLIDECLIEWGAESRPEIRALVNRVFAVEREGHINRADLFSLLRLEIADTRWVRAMDAVRDSIQIIGTKAYVRFYERTSVEAEFSPITIDLAAA